MKQKIILSFLFLNFLSFASDSDSDTESSDSGSVKALTTAMAAHSINSKAASSSAASSSNQAAPFPYKRVYFSPGVNAAFFAILANEQSGLDMAMYRLTHMDVAKEIILRHKLKKLNIVLIVDKDFNKDICNALRHLITNGVVAKYMSGIKKSGGKSNLYENMHHKFVIFKNNAGGRKLLWTGSFNFTGAAENQNWENVVIIDDPSVIAEFEKEFALVDSKSTPINAADCVSNKPITPYTKAMNAI